MLTTDSNNEQHPEEQLGAYALDILDQEEAVLVEFHMSGCYQCRTTVALMQSSAALIGESVDRLQPPASLQARIMRSLPGTGVEITTPAKTTASRGWTGSLSKVLMPLAAVLVLGLLSYSVYVSTILSSRVENLQRESAVLTRWGKLAAQESQVMDRLNELRAASDFLAETESTDVILESPNDSGNSGGILLVADDGRRAMLMVTGMRELEPPSSYDVWLVRQGQSMWAGQLKVDSKGWGAVTLHPPEPLFEFDMVRLTPAPSSDPVPGRGDMVLEGQIVSHKVAR
ncbi:MAG TPA: hypothetical protein EYM54_03590 [Dehalococcoidia bacterium]|nr:hypothetical protein [Dehalococcoidia bacterium]